MKTCKVFYAKDIAAIYRGDARFSDSTHVCVATIDGKKDEELNLEGVFALFNDNPVLAAAGIRSMSPGDVIVDRDTGIATMCGLVGWTAPVQAEH